jgi:hypothetical protein
LAKEGNNFLVIFACFCLKKKGDGALQVPIRKFMSRIDINKLDILIPPTKLPNLKK